ncbi:MAG: mRNA surveillance protein pelota [Candidatus Methanofastidiosa archaeon]|nr:mRNA surveillance protein pelota [Candidatus Methanofastidiosa archaeon]
MRVVHRDLSKGVLKLKVETMDDLWHLSQVLEPGDVVHAVTYRRQQSKADAIRPDKTEKIRIYLGVRLEKVEFSHYADALRLTGVIVEGDQVGSYHTLSIENNDTLTITKAWKGYQVDRVYAAVKATNDPKVLIIALDEGEADFGIVKQYGIDFSASINRNIPGKRDSGTRAGEKEAFFKEVAEKIAAYLRDMGIKTAIVAGPGFVKEEFLAWVLAQRPFLAPSLSIKGISVTGRTGIWEVVKRGYVEEVFQESRVAREITLLEDFFRKILTDEAVYGVREVRQAVENGQAAHVLVTDELLRRSDEVQAIVAKAKNFQSEPYIISTSHEGGEKLRSMGGIAAVLRFKTAY